MQAHLAGGQTTLAYLWKVKRVDGTILGFTGFDQNITFGPDEVGDTVTYLASTGFTGTAVENKSDLSVDNLEATGFLEDGSLEEADLRAGLYDDATIELRLVNWADLTMGDVLLRVGTLGVVKMQNGMFHAELRGLTYKLSTVLGATYGPICRATFGSGLNGIDMNSQWLCMVDVTAYRQTGSVGSVTNAVTLVPASGLTNKGQGTESLVVNMAPSGANEVVMVWSPSASQTGTGTVLSFQAKPGSGMFADIIAAGAGASVILSGIEDVHGINPNGTYPVSACGTVTTGDWGANSPYFSVNTGVSNSTDEQINSGATYQLAAAAVGSTAAPAGWFDNGFITFTSGVLDGYSFEIKSWDGTNLVLYLPMPQAPSPGDTFTIEPGCDHTLGAEGCQKYNNVANFRGEPFIPGPDLYLNYPDAINS